MPRTRKPADSVPAKKSSRFRSKPATIEPAANPAEEPAAATVAAYPAVEEQIRARAYQLFLERGGHGGSAEEDWFRAEAEVRTGHLI